MQNNNPQEQRSTENIVNSQPPAHNTGTQTPYTSPQSSSGNKLFDKLLERPYLMLTTALISAVLAHFFALSLLFFTILFTGVWIGHIYKSKTRYRSLLLVLGYAICLLAFGYMLWGLYVGESSMMNMLDNETF